MAQIMSVQLIVEEQASERIVEELEELLSYTREILAAEVKDEPLEEICFLSLDGDGIRRVSQHVKAEIGIDHPIPHYRMGRMCVALNSLRTQIREVELFAAAAFTGPDGVCSRNDIVKGLNRLSSGVYILFCRKLAGYYDRERGI